MNSPRTTSGKNIVKSKSENRGQGAWGPKFFGGMPPQIVIEKDGRNEAKSSLIPKRSRGGCRWGGERIGKPL